MDLLYHRYSNPFSFLEKMKRKGLANTIKNIWNKEQEDRMFEMYLHSFSDKSFLEYKEEILNQNNNTENQNINDEEKTDIFKKSNDILKNFTPIRKGES